MSWETYSPSEGKVINEKTPTDTRVESFRERENINHCKGCKWERSLQRLSVSGRRNTKQPLWFDSPYMLMLWRPNSCCGSHEAPPPTPIVPPPSQLPTLFERVITKRWSIKCTFQWSSQTWTPSLFHWQRNSSRIDTTNRVNPQPRTSKMLSRSSLSPLFSRAPFANKKKKKKIPSLPPSYFWNVQALTERFTTIRHNPAPS